MNDLIFALWWVIGCLAFLLLIAIGYILFITIGDYLAVHNDRKCAIDELERSILAYYSKRYMEDNFYTDFTKYRLKKYCRKIAKLIISKSYMRKF